MSEEKIIKKLTAEQEAQLEVYRDKWIAIGLSTFQDGDMGKAVELADSIYAAGGLKGPKVHICLSSPMAGAIGSYVLSRTNDVEQLKNISYDRTRRAEDQSMEKMVEFTIGQIRSQVKIDFEPFDVKDGQEKVVGEIRSHLHKAGYGLHDASWLSYYNFFLDVCELECCEKLRPLMNLASCCGWWWPYDNVVIFTERPLETNLDKEGRLHKEDGMAVCWQDGWGVYAWHGVRLPSWIIEHPEEITAEKINNEENIEVRRVMLERFGIDRYVKDSDMEEVQRDKFGVLLRQKDGDREDPLVVVAVEDSTPEPDGTRRNYILRVDADAKTAHEAVAGTFGMTAEEYDPDIET